MHPTGGPPAASASQLLAYFALIPKVPYTGYPRTVQVHTLKLPADPEGNQIVPRRHASHHWSWSLSASESQSVCLAIAW